MKRSEINARLNKVRVFFREQGFALPPWADWSPEEWMARRSDCRAVFGGSLMIELWNSNTDKDPWRLLVGDYVKYLDIGADADWDKGGSE